MRSTDHRLTAIDPLAQQIWDLVARSPPAATDASKITTWVEDHFTAKTVDGVTIYDLATGS